MEKFMQKTLELASTFRGFTSPNPMVGALVVKDGKIIGSGIHQKAGKPHAEVIALNKAGIAATGATLYVNLEPCNHFGKTPPCTDSIIAAKIARVVCAMQDPNPLVAGKGFQKLRENGIEVIENVLQREAIQLNEVYCKSITQEKPFIILKSAITLDGKIATQTGNSQWISNPLASEQAHLLRNSVDAILVGSETFITDNPTLNVRLDQRVSDPYKIILTHKFEFELQQIINSKAYKAPSKKPLIICTTNKSISAKKFSQFTSANINIIQFTEIADLLPKLYKLGITSILLEGGAKLYTSFIQAGKVDKIILFQAPMIIGAEGKSWVSDMQIDFLSEALKFELEKVEKLGDNIMFTLYTKRAH